MCCLNDHILTTCLKYLFNFTKPDNILVFCVFRVINSLSLVNDDSWKLYQETLTNKGSKTSQLVSGFNGLD